MEVNVSSAQRFSLINIAPVAEMLTVFQRASEVWKPAACCKLHACNYFPCSVLSWFLMRLNGYYIPSYELVILLPYFCNRVCYSNTDTRNSLYIVLM